MRAHVYWNSEDAAWLALRFLCVFLCFLCSLRTVFSAVIHGCFSMRSHTVLLKSSWHAAVELLCLVCVRSRGPLCLACFEVRGELCLTYCAWLDVELVARCVWLALELRLACFRTHCVLPALDRPALELVAFGTSTLEHALWYGMV
jgi:hypothetical protein